MTDLIRRRRQITGRIALPLALLTAAGAGWVGAAYGAAPGRSADVTVATITGDVYVAPSGSDSNPGTAAAPVRTVQKAQALVRTLDQAMTRDVTVVLEDGFYRMTSPLTLTAADSGANGHNVVWTADSGARPVLAGSAQITGWTRMSAGSPIWVAQAPSGLQTRQLYVNGVRAARANGTLPNALTGQNSTGYSGGGSTLASWRNPSGASPQLEFVYRGGLGAWTEPRCPVASFSGATVTMAQPCWTNSTARAGSFPDGRAYNLVGRSSITEQPTSVENAFQFLSASTPGQWFLDQGDSKLYYVPRSGETMSTADVEAPVLEKLVTGGGSASAPLHDVVFSGIQFSYATWLGPQFHGQGSSDGFSEIQANYQVTGAKGAAAQGLCHVPPPSYTLGTCPFGAWTQIPGNVSLTYDQDVRFTGDAFVHLGAAGLALGDGSQHDVVQDDVVTDVSGNGIEIGNVDMPTATGASQTLGNAVTDNHVFDVPVEFRGGIGIDSGYTAGDTVGHNQIDHTPYSAISQGWGGWPDKEKEAPQPNFSHGNTISDNLIFDHMSLLNDGGAIYTQGITGTSLATGEHVTGNLIHDQTGSGHVIYTDNGCTFETITGNAVYNNPNAQAWASRHSDYAPGATTTYDPTDVENNYFQNPSGYTTGGGVTVAHNTTITGAGQVPATITANAGIEAAYKGILSWTQAPLPPAARASAATAAPAFHVTTAASGVAGTDDRRPVGGGVYDPTVKTTFVSWSGSNVDNYVQAYNGGTWSKPVKVGAGDGDPHNYPTMVQANDGHLLVFRGLHNTQLMESSSAKPHSIAGTWDDHVVPQGPAATYPMPMKADNGDIYVFYRQTDNAVVSGAPVDERPMEYVRSTDDGVTWTSSKTLTGLPYILGSTTRTDDMNEIYVGQIRHEENPERFTFVWTLAGGGPGHHEHDLYHKDLYFASFTPSDRHFHNAAGRDLGPSIAEGELASCLVVNTGAPVDKNPGYFQLAGTFGDGTPVVLYTLADGNHAAHWTGTGWKSVKLGGDHFLDMEPAGPATFRVFANSGASMVTYLLGETPSWKTETTFTAPGDVGHGVLVTGYHDPVRLLLTGGAGGGVYAAGAG